MPSEPTTEPGPLPEHSRPEPSRRRLLAIALACLPILGVASFFLYRWLNSDEDGPTIAQQLETVEGRPLSTREVQELEEVAALLCRLDDPVLQTIWAELPAAELPFQDFTFSTICPDRATLYALSTGRVVTDEAAKATEGQILPTAPNSSTPKDRSTPKDPTETGPTSSLGTGQPLPSGSVKVLDPDPPPASD